MRQSGRKSHIGQTARKKYSRLSNRTNDPRGIIQLANTQGLDRVDNQQRSLLSGSQHTALKNAYYVPNSISNPSGVMTDVSGRFNPIVLFYNNQLIHFNPANKYLASPEQLWLLESVVGRQTVRQTLAIKRTINNQFIESLFKRAHFAFYLSADEAYLVSSNDELTQLDFGPLTKISALDALQKFGITALEQAKEKTVARL